MFGLGPLEIIVIVVVIIAIYGTSGLPDIGRFIGKGYKEYQSAMKEVEDIKEVVKPGKKSDSEES